MMLLYTKIVSWYIKNVFGATIMFLGAQIMFTGIISNQYILNNGFPFEIRRITFVVLDNACIHRTKAIRERIPYWQKRGLYLFFLSPYYQHLNIAETLWRKLKKE
jgi:transposase